MTDEALYYPRIGQYFDGHESVNHSHDEWARGSAHTNTAEGFFSIFKRGRCGVYQHCGEKHLHRYLAEFDFRYNHRVATGCGKRLTYRRIDGTGFLRKMTNLEPVLSAIRFGL